MNPRLLLATLVLAACGEFPTEPVLCNDELVDLQTNVEHCGQCNNPCEGIRGVVDGMCVQGRCAIADDGCAVGDGTIRLDADGDPATGCEVERKVCGTDVVDVQSDVHHCGDCDYDCHKKPPWAEFALSVECENGVCTATACQGTTPVPHEPPVAVDGIEITQMICREPPERCLEGRETCNGYDDDCDGFIDECPELPGTLPRFCLPSASGDELACPTPICAEGYVAADDNRDDDDGCECLYGGEERCNGLDDDCDGEIDEDENGADLVRWCYDGPDETVGVGICHVGQQTCEEGHWTPCSQAQAPQTERCDALDNDCDGEIDESFDLGERCAIGEGACRVEGQLVCDPTGDATTCSVDEPLEPHAEQCNGIDDDCDGVVDEGEDGDPLTQWCYDGPEPSAVAGVCRAGQQLCQDGAYTECVGQVLPTDELCDGLDNDCDGQADEDFAVGEPCTVGEAPCLSHGERICDETGRGTRCNTEPPASPQSEQCNGIDDDCDGEIDEAFPTLGTECTIGQGQCTASGHVVCSPEGDVRCDAELIEPTDEICDGLDNDCDGEIDEALGETTCGLGACEHTVPNCLEGQPQICDPLEGAQDEVCDGVDNNCDGEIDEVFPLFGDPCSVGQGQCRGSGHFVCTPDGDAVVCDAEPLEPTDEVCDGLDNDCDGEIDEALAETTCGLGPCEHTVPNCLEGQPRVCDPLEGAQDEVCDDFDNDCDGEIDEAVQEPCYTGPEGTHGIGGCQDGARVCTAGQWGECLDQTLPSDEVCDNVDNDCDGETDEALGESTCGLGLCEHTVPNCLDGRPQICDPLEGAEEETCDGLDNDCDGEIDAPLGRCIVGEGPCEREGEYVCINEDKLCDVQPGTPEDERCDGIDNDCNGAVDDNMDPPQGWCFDAGVCAGTIPTCQNGEFGWGWYCVYPDEYEPNQELSADGLDNDCDDWIDEGGVIPGLHPLPEIHTQGLTIPMRTLVPADVAAGLVPGVVPRFWWGCHPDVSYYGGCADHEAAALPQVEVVFDHGFEMMIYEVTVGQYLACVDRDSCPQIESCEGRDLRAPETNRNLPMACVTYDDATTFCEWIGSRLPSEAEWEYAAKGPMESPEDYFLYIGQRNEVDCTMGSFGECANGVMPVGSYAPVPPFDLFDLDGNLKEWVEDCPHINLTNAPNNGTSWNRPCSIEDRAINRGGHWLEHSYTATTILRLRLGAVKDSIQNYYGFRCAR